MQTNFSQTFLETSEGREADSILRSCVHCGFCTATCPTYLLTGNELDSPRGRIYLIKEMLEGGPTSRITQTHLDRCLSCQSCESTCPSNVNYHRLLDIGRAHIDQKVPRSLWLSVKRWGLRKVLVNASVFSGLLGVGRFFKFMLPKKLKQQIPDKTPKLEAPIQIRADRKMLLLNGCVQKSLSPQTNNACISVLAELGVEVVSLDKEGCCGAIAWHLDAQDEGLAQIKHNIDGLYEQLQNDVECIISTGSGCGNFVKQYAQLLLTDEHYAEKALIVSNACKDISEVLASEDLSNLVEKVSANSQKLAFHCPCSLQHGQQLAGVSENILKSLGFSLTQVKESHICCGSAGTYSILQPKLSEQLQNNKIKALMENTPDAVATANVGCQHHLSAVSDKPVKHWIEYVAQGLNNE